MNDQAQPAKAASSIPPTLDHHDIAWIQQETKRLIEYAGDTWLGYQFRDDILPRLNRLIGMRLTEFVYRTPILVLTAQATYAEEVQRRGFTLELELYGARSSKMLQLTQLEALFLDDSLARQIVHDMIAHAAVKRWGR